MVLPSIYSSRSSYQTNHPSSVTEVLISNQNAWRSLYSAKRAHLNGFIIFRSRCVWWSVTVHVWWWQYYHSWYLLLPSSDWCTPYPSTNDRPIVGRRIEQEPRWRGYMMDGHGRCRLRDDGGMRAAYPSWWWCTFLEHEKPMSASKLNITSLILSILGCTQRFIHSQE